MTNGPWYTERGVIASAAVLVAIVLVGGVALLVGGGSSAKRGATVARAQSGRPVPTDGSRCGMPVGNTDTPVGPPEASWRLLGRVAVPASPSVGPGIESGHRRVCWAHSSTGALFAAASFLGMADAYGTDATAMRDILAATHARDVLLRQNAEPHEPFFRAQIAGFHIATASHDYVTVELALQTNEHGAIVAISLPMRWEQRAVEGGDWRVIIADPARPYSGAVIDDLSGFVRWGQA